jgi:hypothetical protein
MRVEVRLIGSIRIALMELMDVELQRVVNRFEVRCQSTLRSEAESGIAAFALAKNTVPLDPSFLRPAPVNCSSDILKILAMLLRL